MVYKVRLSSLAKFDANMAYERIREVAPRSADKWLRGLFQALSSLGHIPTRCLVIPEADELEQPLRQLLYGKRSGIYRIIFDTQEQSEEGPRVRVLRIWHSARDIITAEDIQIEDGD